MGMKKEEQGFSFIEILLSLLLLSLGISSLALILIKCKVMGMENEWRSKTLMMAIGIREAIQVQKQLQKQLQGQSMLSMSGQGINKDFSLDIDQLDLKAWREVLNENFKGSSIEIEHEYDRKKPESVVKKYLGSEKSSPESSSSGSLTAKKLSPESRKQEGNFINIVFIPPGFDRGLSKTDYSSYKGLKILRYSCEY